MNETVERWLRGEGRGKRGDGRWDFRMLFKEGNA